MLVMKLFARADVKLFNSITSITVVMSSVQLIEAEAEV
jgi:hypothetical protein